MKCPVFLISLRQDIHRRQQLRRRFPRHYDDFVHIEAVHGGTIQAATYHDALADYFARTGRIITPEELGCTASHMKALEAFLSSAGTAALILEDDVIGSKDALLHTQDLIQSLDANAVLLCGQQTDTPARRYQLGKRAGNGLIRPERFSHAFIYGTFSYAVGRDAAARILTHHRQHTTLADEWDQIVASTGVKLYYAPVFRHPEGAPDSHIEAQRARHVRTLADKLRVSGLPARIARKARNELNLLWMRARGCRRLP